MKTRKFFLYLAFFLLFSQVSLYAQDLSNSVYNFLKKNKFSPVSQSLVTSADNTFPYNVILNIPSDKETTENLLLVFFQEDVEKNHELFKEFISFLKNQQYDFNITILFSYGERQYIPKDGMIYGSEVYVKQINSNLDYTAIVVDLNNKKNQIIGNSDGDTGPSYLIQNALNTYSACKLKESLPRFYLSQLYTFDFYYERNISCFLNNDIPAIKLCFKDSSLQSETVCKVLKQIVDNYSAQIDKSWGHHFLMVKIFGNYFKLSESGTIKIIIIILFYMAIFLYMLIFINNRLKKQAWSHIKNIWFIFPLTIAFTWLSMFLGYGLFVQFAHPHTDAGKIYFLMAIQLCASFLINSMLYFVILLYNNFFEERSIDYLITLSCIINQSIFILYDISLFPIFMFLTFLSVLSLVTKKNTIHIIIFLLMIVAFVPYANNVITTAELDKLEMYLMDSKIMPVILSLILCPVYLVYLRVLVFYRSRNHKAWIKIVSVSISIIIMCSSIIIIGVVRTKQVNSVQSSNKYIITNDPKQRVSCSYYDKKIFADTIRYINVSIDGQPVQCDVKITSSNHTPILYTDNDYEQLTQESVYFMIPSYPPEKMTFSYGTSTDSCIVSVIAVFDTEEENVYTLSTTSLSIGEIK